MALRTSSHFTCVVVAGVSCAAGMRIVSHPHRPGTGTLMTRRTRSDGCDKVSRRFCRGNVRRIRPIMIAVVTGLTRFEGDHRMIHGGIGEGAARILVAIVTIDFRTAVQDRNVRFRIRIIGDVGHLGRT